MDLGLPVDPVLLTGLTTALLIAPTFTARWHLGGRIEGLTRAAGASIRQRLLAKSIAALKAEGLWARQQTLARPRDITTIAIVHPANAAGWADIAGGLDRWRQAGIVRVRSLPAPFEGDRSVAAIVAAITAAAQPADGHRADVLMVIRGGGASVSLAALDDEAVARAVCRCPVPVIVGTGHAIDRTLVDQVAWRTTDTPSKALALVAGLMVGTARAVAADRDAILACAANLLAVHHLQLTTRHHELDAAIAGAMAAAAADLAVAWSDLVAARTAVAERCRRRGEDIDRHLADVLVCAPLLLERQHHELRQRLRTGLSRAAGLLAGLDGGVGVMARIGLLAASLLDREADALARLRQSVQRDAERCVDASTAALAALAAAIEAGDLVALLQRGLTIVTDADGRLVSTRAAAAGLRRLSIHFADGVLSVAPIDIVPTDGPNRFDRAGPLRQRGCAGMGRGGQRRAAAGEPRR